jgi:hypothetical protein
LVREECLRAFTGRFLCWTVGKNPLSFKICKQLYCSLSSVIWLCAAPPLESRTVFQARCAREILRAANTEQTEVVGVDK